MLELRDIPLTYKEGVYSVVDFGQDIEGDNSVSFDYDAQYQMLDYDIPVGKEQRKMTLYSVPEGELVRTLRAVYGKDGTLQKITAVLKGRETLLYIRYENSEICYPKCRCHNQADPTMHRCCSKTFYRLLL